MAIVHNGMRSGSGSDAPATARWITLGLNCADLPERLLLAHARGEVLFVTGAGTSRPALLPGFKELVLQAYRQLDPAVYERMVVEKLLRPPVDRLNSKQAAELRRFDNGEFDMVLGMLELRIDGPGNSQGKVRQTICELVRTVENNGRRIAPKPAPIHRSLVRLANRGIATTIATTNFDRLLQAAAGKTKLETSALAGIPRPTMSKEFSGVLHIHGALADSRHPTELVVTDRDFGEYYLRRRTVPDFIYDAARLFNLVLVGYSVNDAPMRYLLNAVAADGSRFRDLRERFVFVPGAGTPDPVELEDWTGRGITPIPYDQANRHQQLGTTLERWATLSAINGDRVVIRRLLSNLVRKPRSQTAETEKDLFDHLYRRSGRNERLEIAAAIGNAGASIEWLDAMNSIAKEPGTGAVA